MPVCLPAALPRWLNLRSDKKAAMYIHSRRGESLLFQKAIQPFEQADLLRLLVCFAALFPRQLTLEVRDDQPLLFTSFGGK